MCLRAGNSLGVLSFVTTLMSCSISSNEFIAPHSYLSHVTDHRGISQNRSTNMLYKRVFGGHVVKGEDKIRKLRAWIFYIIRLGHLLDLLGKHCTH